MKDTQRGILNLICSAITKQPLPLPDGFSLDSAEALIKSHQIDGIVYEGAVVCGIKKTEPVMARLFQRYCQLMICNNAQLSALHQLFAAFEKNSIDYLPVKGFTLKELYPNPAMRTMGDADILIRLEQYDKIRSIMEELGYCKDVEEDHAFSWKSKALYLELHQSLIPRQQTTEYDYFKDIWNRAVHINGHRYDLSNEDAFVFLFLHYVKHYRNGGIGLRQLTDLWLWQMLRPQTDMTAVRQALQELKLLQFFEYTQQMLQVWFAGAAEDERILFMTDYIFSSGSWGTFHNTKASQALQVATAEGSNRKARLKIWLDAIFPPAKKMVMRYPVLDKAPWLLPVLWPYRWVTAALFRRNNIRKHSIGMSSITDENIRSREQALAYVGLDLSLYKK